MTELQVNRLKKDFVNLSPDSHKAFLSLLKEEAKRQKDNFLPVMPSVKRSWERWLSSSEFNFSVFATLTTQGGLTAKQIHRHVEKWFEMLVKRLNLNLPVGSNEITDDQLRIFWVAESNTKNVNWHTDKFHLHLLIECSPSIHKNLFIEGQYQKFNFFDTAWQFTQGRKPFIMKTDKDSGLTYKHYLDKFRTQFVDLSLHKSANTAALERLTNNRIKYCAKYVAKDVIQFGFLSPSKVRQSVLHDGEWINSNDYRYEWVTSN